MVLYFDVYTRSRVINSSQYSARMEITETAADKLCASCQLKAGFYREFIQRLLFIKTILRAPQIKFKEDKVLWQIPNFEAIRQMNKLSKTPKFQSIVSEPFTLTNGFMFRLRLFANGAGKSKGIFLSLYVQMGASGKRLFRGVVTFVMMDQSSFGKHCGKSFLISSSNAAFQQGEKQYGEAMGVEQFIAQEKIWNSRVEHSFVQNNTVIIGAMMQYIDGGK